jgi:hypothetical protein
VLTNAQHRTLEGQTHAVAPEVLAPVLEEFFASGNGTRPRTPSRRDRRIENHGCQPIMSERILSSVQKEREPNVANKESDRSCLAESKTRTEEVLCEKSSRS